MKIENLFGVRLREDPREAELISHKLMLRAGYIRQNASGIFTYLPLGYRVFKKLIDIMREEMDRIGGQEVLLPYVTPKELWEQTGRYYSVKEELLRFNDRTGRGYVLAMTHEESVAFIAKSELFSYKQLPVMIYQFQLKFRDEPRARGGLIRVREFTMKDAYSIHMTPEDLNDYYYKVFEAYERIFKRAGLKNFISVQSDVGMMGGSVSHEFMLIADSGEDTLIICPSCSYKANKEIATANIEEYHEDEKELELAHTPDKKTIEEVARFLNLPLYKTGKAVFYYNDDTDELIFVLIRGDREVNETKLKNYLKTKNIRFATDEEIKKVGAEPGFASPVNINFNEKLRILVDRSILTVNNIVVGANKKDYHYKNFNFERDLNKGEIVDIFMVEEGDKCPECGSPLYVKRGIEIGNIFQLGYKYSKAFNIEVLDENGKKVTPIMGSYGIGVGRLAAAIIEESHDENGIIWPISVAPFEVHLIALNPKDKKLKEISDEIYSQLTLSKIEVLYDDRKESAGVKFADADLIGIPFQVIISPRNLKENKIEIKRRDNGKRIYLSIDNGVENLVKMIKDIIEEEKKKFKI